MNMFCRVRFAPSPTGPLHIGGVRTALYNYLFAKKNNGSFILRIEDTDQNRFVPGAEEYIVESLKWCGLSYDEGPRKEGNFGPYRQSERKEIYKQYSSTLIESGNAYYAFDSTDELGELRKKAESKGETFTYNYINRNNLLNSVSLTEKEVEKKIKSGFPFIIRFKTPKNRILTFQDEIRGKITINTNTLDDKILFKSDGMPTYHLANVVDDYLMNITYVIRGEEWLPSLALHVLLYESFGWNPPKFAHLPLILKPSGKGKLSKRDGQKHGFPIFSIPWKDPNTKKELMSFEAEGYRPEATLNILALLGWNPGTEKEIFSLEELVREFSLEKIGKSGAIFNPEKAKWFNQQHIQNIPTHKWVELIKKEVETSGYNIDNRQIIKIIDLLKPRVRFIKDILSEGDYFFKAPTEVEEKTKRKVWKENTNVLLSKFVEAVKEKNPADRDSWESLTKKLVETEKIGFGQLMKQLRICISGKTTGPDLFSSMDILGAKKVIKRIQKTIRKIT